MLRGVKPPKHREAWEAKQRRAPGRVLIVGSAVYGDKPDRRAMHNDVIGVDMQAGPGVDLVVDMTDQLGHLLSALGTFAHIECQSVLEHCRKPWVMAENMVGLLQPGGSLHISVPFVWTQHGYPNDYWRFTHNGVRELFPRIQWVSTAMVTDQLEEEHKVKRILHGEHPYLPRTEMLMWGVLPT
jgi:hypothetical protein